MSEAMTPEMDRILAQQVGKWADVENRRKRERKFDVKVVTVSRQAGSGGKLIAARVAQETGLKYYDRELIQKVALSAKTDPEAVRTRDEKGHSMVESWFDSLVHQRQLLPGRYLRHLDLRPDEYLQHLTKVVLDIGEREGGVIVGRGANFIFPRENCLRVRVVAPLEMRMDYIASIVDISTVRAKLLILQREADRKAFAKHYFQANIDDPSNYDLVFNMDLFTLDEAIESVMHLWNATQTRSKPKKAARKTAARKKPARKPARK